MSVSILSTWLVGSVHGYQSKEKKLPSSITYGTIGVTSLLRMIQTLGNSSGTKPREVLTAMFVGIPIIVGSVFCLGHQVGKSVRHLQDQSYDDISV